MIAVPVPMSDPSGQPAGFVSNCEARHAFWIVVSLEGKIFGIVKSTFAMLASPGLCVISVVRLAPFALLVFACVENVYFGLNGRL